MPAPQMDDDIVREAWELVAQHGGVMQAARAAGIPRGTMTHRYARAKARYGDNPPPPKRDREFDVSDLPDELPTADELLKRRAESFARKHKAREARKLVPVQVNVDGPFAVAHLGDPHVDDDGTDLVMLQRHVEIIKRTPAMFAGNVGDYSNNWVGRLARLYADQSITAREAWVLVEWLVQAVPWLYLIGGNHDLWTNNAGDPVQWMSRQANTLYEHHGVRLGLTTPNGRVIRVNARHDFQGHSMWNTTHGPAKAAQLGWRDHVLTCGHKHTSGYQMLVDPSSGLISHAIRVGSYKVHDSYATEKGLPNQTAFRCAVTIINPDFPDDDVRCITTLFDPEVASDFLTFLRKKGGYATSRKA